MIIILCFHSPPVPSGQAWLSRSSVRIFLCFLCLIPGQQTCPSCNLGALRWPMSHCVCTKADVWLFKGPPSKISCLSKYITTRCRDFISVLPSTPGISDGCSTHSWFVCLFCFILRCTHFVYLSFILCHLFCSQIVPAWYYKYLIHYKNNFSFLFPFLFSHLHFGRNPSLLTFESWKRSSSHWVIES